MSSGGNGQGKGDGDIQIPLEHHCEVLLLEESAKMSFKLHIWITTGRVRAAWKSLCCSSQ